MTNGPFILWINIFCGHATGPRAPPALSLLGNMTFNNVTPLDQGWLKTFIWKHKRPQLKRPSRNVQGCRRGLGRNLHIPEFGLYEEKEAKRLMEELKRGYKLKSDFTYCNAPDPRSRERNFYTNAWRAFRLPSRLLLSFIKSRLPKRRELPAFA